MKLYNDMSLSKEEFIPIEPEKVRMYVCGPTVYNLIHVGNARPFVVFDVLRRYLEYKGMEVTYVQNFTDVDDKIIKRAQSENMDPMQVGEKYIGEYFHDAEALGIKRATIHPRATENIQQIIELTALLLEKGYAYEIEGDVYFRTEAFKDYGRLSRNPLEELLAGARISVNEEKETPLDFALWKSAKEGEISWNSPWGQGRPGWHIECSAMAKRHLGESIDIHCGGMDLTFPHHENEIAQSEAASGKPFVNYWLHNGFISIDSEKMSKSLGNFFTVREAASSHGYDALRMFLLMAHYRNPLNYSEEILLQAGQAHKRLLIAKQNMKFVIENGREGDLDRNEEEALAALGKYREDFIKAMDDDLNTADAVTALFEMVRGINSMLSLAGDPKRQLAQGCLRAFSELGDVLGLPLEAQNEGLDDEIERKIEERQEARKAKNFAEADRIRDELAAQGIIIEDTPQGVKWRRE